MVEGTRLESVRTLKRTAGSNPALSASKNLNRTPVERNVLGFFFAVLIGQHVMLYKAVEQPLKARIWACRVFIILSLTAFYAAKAA